MTERNEPAPPSPDPAPEPAPTSPPGVAPPVDTPPARATAPTIAWASLAITIALVALAVLDGRGLGLGGRRVWQVLGLSRDLLETGELWRLVTASFVHRSEVPYGFVAAATLFCVAWNIFPGARVTADRLIGVGAALFLFVIGGAAGNLVRVLLEPPEVFASVPGGYPGGLAMVAAAAVASRRARLPRSGEISWALYRAVAALGAVATCGDPTVLVQPDRMGQAVAHAFPGVAAGIVIGVGFGLLVPPIPSRAARSILGPLLGISALVALFAGIGGAAVHHQRERRERAFQVDPQSTLVARDEASLGLTISVPDSFIETQRQKSYVQFQSISGPRLLIYSLARSGGMSEGDLIYGFFASLNEQNLDPRDLEPPDQVKAGKLRGERRVVAVTMQGQRVTARIYAFVGRDRAFVLSYFHEPTDSAAPDIADAIAASLKERGDASDKSQEKERPK